MQIGRRCLVTLLIALPLAACAAHPQPAPAGNSVPAGTQAPQTSQTPAVTAPQAPARDIWVLAVDDAREGRVQAGKHVAFSGAGDIIALAPDGRHALVATEDPTHCRNPICARFLTVLTLQSGERRELPVGSDWWALAGWRPDGHLLLVGSGHLWLGEGDGSKLKDVGDPGSVAAGAAGPGDLLVWSYHVPDGGYALNVYHLDTGKSKRYPGPWFPSGHPMVQLVPMLSPDGRSAAFYVSEPQGLHILDLEQGKDNVVLKQAHVYPLLWTKAGLWCLLAGDSHDVALVDAAGQIQRRFPLGDATIGRFSPDGRWLAVTRQPPGARAQQQLGLIDLSSGALTWTAVANHLPIWTADGQLLLWSSPD